MRGSLPPATLPLGVYYLRSTDNGETWSAPELISDGSGGFPRLVAAAGGALHRLWVQPGANQADILHQWSSDGGQTWTAPSPVPAPRRLEPNLGLVADAGDVLFLVGIEAGPQDSASLFYLRWDGAQWADPESLALGYAADAGSGATALLLPGRRLAVLSRVTSFAGLATGLHVLAYTERQVPAVDQPASATATPAPTAAVSPTAQPSPTWTAIPTVSPDAPPPAASSNTLLVRIGLILAAMLLVVLVAFQRLRANRRYP